MRMRASQPRCCCATDSKTTSRTPVCLTTSKLAATSCRSSCKTRCSSARTSARPIRAGPALRRPAACGTGTSTTPPSSASSVRRLPARRRRSRWSRNFLATRCSPTERFIRKSRSKLAATGCASSTRAMRASSTCKCTWMTAARTALRSTAREFRRMRRRATRRHRTSRASPPPISWSWEPRAGSCRPRR